MTTTDTDALTERIRRARSVPAEWARLREGESTREQIERHQRRMDEQTAALVAEEVRKAKAEALHEAAAAMEGEDEIEWPFNGMDEMRRWLSLRAAEYEAGDSDERR